MCGYANTVLVSIFILVSSIRTPVLIRGRLERTETNLVHSGCVPELLAAVASTVGLRNVGQYWRCPATGRERNAAPAADQSRLLWTVVNSMKR